MNPVKSVRWPGMEAKPYGHPGSGSEPEHPNCSSSPCLSPLPLVLLPPAPPHFPALHILALLLLRFHLPLLHSPCLNDSSRLCTTEALWPVWPVSVWASAVRLAKVMRSSGFLIPSAPPVALNLVTVYGLVQAPLTLRNLVKNGEKGRERVESLWKHLVQLRREDWHLKNRSWALWAEVNHILHLVST